MGFGFPGSLSKGVELQKSLSVNECGSRFSVRRAHEREGKPETYPCPEGVWVSLEGAAGTKFRTVHPHSPKASTVRETLFIARVFWAGAVALAYYEDSQSLQDSF